MDNSNGTDVLKELYEIRDRFNWLMENSTLSCDKNSWSLKVNMAPPANAKILDVPDMIDVELPYIKY